MCANLGADAVLERRHDLAARGVILGVRAEDDADIKSQTHGVALNLHVAFLHDVKERNLDFAGEVWHLVDGEDAAVGTGQQAVMHGQLIGEIVPGARGLDRVEIADQVGHGHVRRRELFHVTVFAAHPGDGRVVAVLGDQLARVPGERLERVIANFRACNVGRPLVEQVRQRAQDAALGLSTQPQQDEVVLREHGVHNLRNHRVVIADDAGKDRAAVPAVAAQTGNQVFAQLILDGAILEARLAVESVSAQLAECAGQVGGSGCGLD
jgi:hypothetical protein